RRRPRGVRQLEGLATESLDHLLMDDLDDLLGGGEALREVGLETHLADASDKVFYDLEVDVGFEQRETDLAQHLIDVFFTERAAASEPGEDRVEAIGEGVEHAVPQATRRAPAALSPVA